MPKCLEISRSRRIIISNNLLSFGDRFKISRKSLRVLYAAGARRIWLLRWSEPVYAMTRIRGKKFRLHRAIMRELGYKIKNKHLDHKNGNPLDNRVTNLRIATHKQNMANLKLSKRNTSGYKGVFLFKDGRKSPWMAHIGGPKTRVYLGFYGSAEEAAAAYNRAAKKRFGKFAKLNCIPKHKG